jgi:hypothetical protein
MQRFATFESSLTVVQDGMSNSGPMTVARVTRSASCGMTKVELTVIKPNARVSRAVRKGAI